MTQTDNEDGLSVCIDDQEPSPEHVPGVNGPGKPIPSVVVGLFGTTGQAWDASLTADETFELFHDAGADRGWEINTSSNDDLRNRGGLWECYEAGTDQPSSPHHTVVAWCHIGLHASHESPASILPKVAICLTDLHTQLGGLDLFGLQATLQIGHGTALGAPEDHGTLRPPTSSELAAHVVVAPALYVDPEEIADDPANVGAALLLDMPPDDIERQLSSLRAHLGDAPTIAIEAWSGEGLAEAATRIAQNLARDGLRGEHRITLIRA